MAGAPSGRSARVELTLDVSGDSSLGQVVQRSRWTGARSGVTVTLPLQADLPPTLETQGIKVGYRIRVIVDRMLRADESRERPIVVC